MSYLSLNINSVVVHAAKRFTAIKSSMMPLINQLFRFGVVGGVSTLLNSVIFIVLVDFLNLRPLSGNLFAFLLVFWVSYFGHSWWTFGNKYYSTEKFLKFLLMALLGLSVNATFVWILMHCLHQSAYIATLPMIFITPLLIFFINKYWVFKQVSLADSQKKKSQ
jgi:putative flippase GtrA